MGIYTMTLTVRVHENDLREAMQYAGAQMPKDWKAWVEQIESDFEYDAGELWNEKVSEYIQNGLDNGDLSEPLPCVCDDSGWVIMNGDQIQRCGECEKFESDIDAALACKIPFFYDPTFGVFQVVVTPTVTRKIERQMYIQEQLDA